MQSLVNYIKGDELPSATTPIEISEGILWFRFPMPIALDHINIYLLEDNDGWVLIDTGMADPVSIETWEIILKKYTAKRPIIRIIGTHFHPDHVGLAGWLLDRIDAEFWMSQIEWLSARQAYLDAEEVSLVNMRKFYDLAGLGTSEKNLYYEIGNDYREMVSPIPSVYKRIEKETIFLIGGRTWQPIFGSGHSPDHVTLYNKKDQIVLGGDMLLPRITPIIAVWWQEPDGNPLDGYLKFLEGIEVATEETIVLPAHDLPYKGLLTRIKDLIQHHQNRLEITFECCSETVTASCIMKALFRRDLDAFQTRFAIGETIAHINYLLHKKEISRHLSQDHSYLYQKNKLTQ